MRSPHNLANTSHYYDERTYNQPNTPHLGDTLVIITTTFAAAVIIALLA